MKTNNLLPLLGGDYAVDSIWYTDGKLQAVLRVQFTLT